MRSPADLADPIADFLARREAQLVREQAVRGFDALAEVELHPLVAEACAAAGFGVTREARYPSDRRHHRENRGDRCDLVLTEDGRAFVAERKRATLFDDPDAAAPEEATWVEMKTVAQFTEEGPNPRYAAELGGAIRADARKLAADPSIVRAALVVLLFVQHPEIARHDLMVWLEQSLDRGVPVGVPSVRLVPIAERLGHAACAVAVFPVSGIR